MTANGRSPSHAKVVEGEPFITQEYEVTDEEIIAKFGIHPREILNIDEAQLALKIAAMNQLQIYNLGRFMGYRAGILHGYRRACIMAMRAGEEMAGNLDTLMGMLDEPLM